MDFVAIAGGGYHSLGLRTDGSIVAWGAGQPGWSGYPHHGQCDVPEPNVGFVALAAGAHHSLGVKGYPHGDMNCDAAIDVYDIDGFILAVSSYPEFEAYYEQYPDCEPTGADCNADGIVNAYDIDPFIALVGGG